MEVPITQFRKNIFELVNQAAEGKDVRFTHKGRRFRVVPEDAPVDKLSRITPMQVFVDENFDPNDPAFRAEWMAAMEKEWEEDWAQIGPPAPDDHLS
jgi:prevent-host-death family protein